MSRQLTQSETLFDDDSFDDKIEHIVDTRGVSYDDASRMVGVSVESSAPEIQNASSAQEGVSVELGARALALHNIMATYNQLNKTRGARLAGAVPGNSFDSTYRYPDEVRENMGLKATAMINSNYDDFRTLNATDELVAAGFDKTAVFVSEKAIQRNLLNVYGPGKAYAKQRSRLVKKVEKSSKTIHTSLQT